MPTNKPLIVELLYSYGLGGSEVLGAQLAIAFRNRGYDVKCMSIHHSAGPIRDLLESEGIECEGLGYDQRGYIDRLRIGTELSRWFRAAKPAVLHCQHALTLVRSVLPARSAGVDRIVMTEHTDEGLRAGARYRRATCRAIRNADAVTVIHEPLRDYFIDVLQTPRQKVSVVHNGVVVPDTPVVVNGSNGDVRLVYVGRLHPDKDLPTLLHALAEVISRQPRRTIKLLIAGEGELRASLQGLADRLGLHDAVDFLGVCNNVSSLLSSADIFVMSSKTEGVPLALMEAMAHGLPCVVTAVGGIPTLLEDKYGIAVPAGDPLALAAALCEFIDSPERAALIGAKARELISAKFNFEHVVDRYLEIFGLKTCNPAVPVP